MIILLHKDMAKIFLDLPPSRQKLWELPIEKRRSMNALIELGM